MEPLRPRRRLHLFAASLLLAGAAACDGREVGTDAAARGPVRGVVVVCIDTLRADSLSIDSGSPESGRRGSMPALDAFARSGTAFLDASSSAAWTAPAVSTLLTGLEPSKTGVHGPVTSDQLVQSVPTLAARLKSAGWSTWAFTGGGIVQPDRGLASGFDGFFTTFDADGPEACVARWSRERDPRAPYFLFLHTYAAHDPYGPKNPRSAPPQRMALIVSRAEGLLQQASEDGGRLSRESMLWFLDTFLLEPFARSAIYAGLGELRARRAWREVVDWIDGPGLGSAEMTALARRLKDAYVAGLPQTDAVFARTLAALQGAGVGRDAAVIVLADHGEAFGEHGTVSHGRWLYDEMTRIPLVVRAPGRFPVGTVRGSCGIVDVAPTVLDLAGVAPTSALDGTSLRGLARGEPSGRPILAEEERIVRDGVWMPLKVASVRLPTAKYVLTWNAQTDAVVREELYDLTRDPGETTSLLPATASRFGAPFCAAVHRLRAARPDLDAGRPCAEPGGSPPN